MMMAGDNSSFAPGKKINFRSKLFTFIRRLGSGGTGTTFLFREESAGMLFAVKKFDPVESNDSVECYQRFVDEIKILMHLTHPNIVRCFDYYLYPEKNTGYLQMEYVDGVTIDKFQVTNATKSWNEIFSDVVSAFEVMERCKILHRDIRPENIMIDNNGNVKIIDFGFGKDYNASKANSENSVFLNWPAPPPDEVVQCKIYNHKTEIYYLGKLMQNLPKEDDQFDYDQIIERMAEPNPSKRFQSFFEVREAMGSAAFGGRRFSSEEKAVYQGFADALIESMTEVDSPVEQIMDADTVQRKLKRLLEDSSLEENVQGNDRLINCFVKSGFKYWDCKIPVDLVERFYSFFTGLLKDDRELVLQNLSLRLLRVRTSYSIDDEEIPF